ncbi:MAG TPA: Gfo/Idh/MocA family oxidoreductase [Flavitalea sp.]|nr:Gfo/Idh/MocA family oxidoreductase [Flavitalea sp.]
MKRKEFGIGIIGAGLIANFHAKAVDAIENAELIGVYNINKDKSDAFAYAHHCISFASLEDLLGNPRIDIVCICTPSGLHADAALKCIAAAKHCLVEKPLDVTLEKCDQIINAAIKAEVKVGVIFPSRFFPVNRELKRQIQNKRFGDLVLGDAYVKWFRSAEYYKSAKWRGTWELDGGGALMNQGIHSVDLIQWFMGPVESVHAFKANAKHRGIEVEDTIVAVLKFSSGAMGTIECSTAVFPGSAKRIEILGTNGTAIVEENNLIKWEFRELLPEDSEIKKAYASVETVKGGFSGPSDIDFYGHQKQIEDMIRAIEMNQSVEIDAVEGRKSVEIVLAIYQSAESGLSVKLA